MPIQEPVQIRDNLLSMVFAKAIWIMALEDSASIDGKNGFFSLDKPFFPYLCTRKKAYKRQEKNCKAMVINRLPPPSPFDIGTIAFATPF